MLKKVLERWEQNDEEGDCPHCGAENCCIRIEEDDGYDKEGHWTDWTYECLECGKPFVARWYLASPTLYEVMA